MESVSEFVQSVSWGYNLRVGGMIYELGVAYVSSGYNLRVMCALVVVVVVM